MMVWFDTKTVQATIDRGVFLAQATIGELRAALEELRQSKERLVQALNPAELFVSSISSRS